MNSFFKDNANDLDDYTRISSEIGKRPDYVQGGGGNTSVKLKDNRMAIKASGYTLSDITPNSSYAVVDYIPVKDFYLLHEPEQLADIEKQGSAITKECTLQIDGLQNLRPSVEAGFHSILNKYVAHSHSVYANLITCARQGEQLAAQALDGADYTWAFIPYTDPGARLTFSIRDEMRRAEQRTGSRPNAILLQNHGFIATHDDAQQALRIHEDANNRIAQLFSAPAFPKTGLEQRGEGFISDTPYLRKHLASGNYPPEFFIEQALYPDQLVFLLGTLVLDGEPGEDQCAIDTQSGRVTYRMSQTRAMVIEQTLCAIVYIVENIKKEGYALSTMGDAARTFIENWESEKYRKSITK